MAGALDFLDTLVGAARDVSVARSNADAATGRITDQTKVPYTSPLQVKGAPLGGYLPLIIGVLVLGVAVVLIARR
jgi:hypothetical protein